MKKLLLILTVALASAISLAQTTGGTTSKFDFIPGEKIIFFDDFSAESIGDFPAQWLTNGSGEIVTMSKFEGRWFQLTTLGYYIPEVRESFTENYTIEFDLIIVNNAQAESADGVGFFLLSADLANPSGGGQPGVAGFKVKPDYEYLFWNNWSEIREWQGDEGQANVRLLPGEKYRMAFWFQKQRVRVYANDNKLLDLPRGLQANYIYNVFRIEDESEDTTPFIANFRIAAGLPDMRNRLITEGKIISYGILFDVNSDKLKPESAPSIKEIVQVLNDNPGVRIIITGHTDNTGDDALNLDLSRRRAESVKNEMIRTYSIDPSRLETEGKGESQPLAPNDNALNKSKNRRVEFIKL
jgi:OmpA-OmpF porin, OOP family